MTINDVHVSTVFDSSCHLRLTGAYMFRIFVISKSVPGLSILSGGGPGRKDVVVVYYKSRKGDLEVKLMNESVR